MLEDASYENDQLVLAPDNYLVLYTDGIPEARSPEDRFFGGDNFRKLLSENAGKPAHQICDHLINKVIEYQAGELADDITLLVLRRNS